MDKPDTSASDAKLTKELIVQNKMGIHARPAAMIVRITNKFKAEVFVEKEDEQVLRLNLSPQVMMHHICLLNLKLSLLRNLTKPKSFRISQKII